MTKDATSALAFQPVGNFGVEFAEVGEHVLFRVPRDGSKGVPSTSGKMKLTASTGGWASLPGASGLRINIMAGVKA